MPGVKPQPLAKSKTFATAGWSITMASRLLAQRFLCHLGERLVTIVGPRRGPAWSRIAYTRANAQAPPDRPHGSMEL